ncbi:bifunctional DNA-formamidopyrimidine glycosylase/DNA-(apurinic or apyrimidinic site) lyase [Cytobacillus sp. NCCP-133]|uniref:bifunctional DNA-formamidopyrimidine glycosylase/DNA-(apurinic or apyrimidinic site) lyase n=1 Tax=Cytobacillus sp. NCCP-133 TaxID=766848 RepID=UPI00222E1172|nr:bifunctional DNA-formamidopyrimidine glycosylase/DNA-(apurinic or apyrimidinic site) lyase [Cytobacillus sp. NCCP-133]GLB59997.1 DNA-formamidopyrimidine glycosylase [Cytobacillus sp. NCCP-133]
MPELPEMEIYRRILTEKLAGKTITGVEVNREKSINVNPAQFKSELINSGLTEIQRKAKHLIFKLSSGKSLLLHLMLGGWMYMGNDEDSPERTKQVILSFGDKKLYFIGLRLGYLHLLTDSELEKELADLGPDPMDQTFSYPVFRELIGGRRGMLKTTFVNQQFLSGIGNCYSDEICFEAGLLPMKKADDLDEDEIKILYQSLKGVLTRAIQFGGYMEEPFFKGDTKTGGYNEQCRVYDREGEPCLRCSTAIVKEEISSRKTFYCRNCQT